MDKSLQKNNQNGSQVLGIYETTKTPLKHIRVSRLGSQDIRFIGKDGYGNFDIDGVEDRTKKTLKMTVLHVEMIICKDFYLFNENFKKYQQMAEVIFLDGNNKLSGMVVKTESLGNLLTVLRRIEMDGKNAKEVIIEARSVDRVNDKNKYSAMEFDVVGDVKKEVTKEVQMLFTDHQDILFAASRWLTGQMKIIPREEADA